MVHFSSVVKSQDPQDFLPGSGSASNALQVSNNILGSLLHRSAIFLLPRGDPADLNYYSSCLQKKVLRFRDELYTLVRFGCVIFLNTTRGTNMNSSFGYNFPTPVSTIH
jgi:hypothetical protein